jgi:pimeloyl-ACP methyl ester carboxylesterase
MLRVRDDQTPDRPGPDRPGPDRQVAAQQELARSLSAQSQLTQPQPVQPWPGRLVELPSGQIYVRVADPTGVGSAAAPPRAGEQAVEHVLFVHGLGGSSTNWTDLMDLLSRPSGSGPTEPILSCAALDLPGFGFSPPPPDGSYNIWAHVRSVISLIEYLGQAPIHLVGNSMGGAILTKVAALRPDLVRSLTLISPALPDLRPRPLPMRLAVLAAPGVGKALLYRIGRRPAAARTDMTVSELYSDPALMHPLRRDQEIAEVIRRDSVDYALSALMLSARAMVAEYFRAGRKSLWRDAAAVTAPALILHGSSDRLVNPVMAVKAARTFRTARVVILPAVGHVAMMEQPVSVAGEIRSFLDWVRIGDGAFADAAGPGAEMESIIATP